LEIHATGFTELRDWCVCECDSDYFLKCFLLENASK